MALSAGGERAGTRKRARKPWCTRDFDSFTILKRVGEGEYGKVFIATDNEDDQSVALKLVKPIKEMAGFSTPALREVKIMRLLHHKNIVHLRDVLMARNGPGSEPGSAYLVMEACEYDLDGIVKRMHDELSPRHIRFFMQQLLEGLFYIHTNNIVHRDLKTANILVSKDLTLKIADWGMARSIVKRHRGRLTKTVITQWYRPPELLLGASKYHAEVDMWSAGCILGEMVLGTPLLPGKSEAEQLQLIFRLIGPPDETWPHWDPEGEHRPFAGFAAEVSKPEARRHRLEARFAGAVGPHGASVVDLLRRLLDPNPATRITAEEALDHDYFWQEDPARYRNLRSFSQGSMYGEAAREIRAKRKAEKVK